MHFREGGGQDSQPCMGCTPLRLSAGSRATDGPRGQADLSPKSSDVNKTKVTRQRPVLLPAMHMAGLVLPPGV